MTPADARQRLKTDPFSWRATKSGDIFIERGGKTVTILRGSVAETFRSRIDRLSEDEAQHLMARTTGHYRHGNER